MHRGTDAFNTFNTGEAAEPTCQYTSTGDHRSDRHCRVENTLEGFGRKPRAVILDGQPHIVTRSEFDDRVVIDRILASSDDEVAAARHVSDRRGDEIADHLRDCIRVGETRPQFGQQRKAAVYRIWQSPAEGLFERCKRGIQIGSSWWRGTGSEGKLQTAREVAEQTVETIEQPI